MVKILQHFEDMEYELLKDRSALVFVGLYFINHHLQQMENSFLNNKIGVFETEVDESGHSIEKHWEWK